MTSLPSDREGNPKRLFRYMTRNQKKLLVLDILEAEELVLDILVAEELVLDILVGLTARTAESQENLVEVLEMRGVPTTVARTSAYN